jgi:transcription-repair coupling factor (superfamily II helicase)
MDRLQRYLPQPMAERLAKRLAGSGPAEPLTVPGLYGSSPAFFSALLGGASGARTVLLVAPDNQAIAGLERDLTFYGKWLDPGARVQTFPMPEVSPYHAIPPHFDIVRDRLTTLAALAEGGEERTYVVASAGALLHRTYSPKAFGEYYHRIAEGEELPPARLAARLDSMGYRRVDIVVSVGDFAVRGNVFDFFPVTSEQPVRLIYYDDMVEAIRFFEPESQRSVGSTPSVGVVPAREYLLDADGIRVWALRARRRWTGKAAQRDLEQKIETLEQSGILPELEGLRHLLDDGPGWSLLDHLGGDSLTLLLEPELVDEALAGFGRRMEADYSIALQEGSLALPPDEIFIDPQKVMKRLNSGRSVRLGGAGALMETDGRGPDTEEGARYGGQVHLAAEAIRRSLKDGDRVCLVLRTRGKRDRLVEILREYELSPRREEDLDRGAAGEDFPGAGAGPSLHVLDGHLSRGFRHKEAGLTFITDDEIFGVAAAGERKKEKRRGAVGFTTEFRDLAPGDLIVHVDHGIGRFVALRSMEREGEQDFMVLEYRGGDRLMVPLERMDLVQKYSGLEEGAPPLDRLGGQSWARTKARIKKSMQDMARELINLYAARALVRGYAFSPDTEWQREFEESFEFVETPDQRTAIDDLKEDMERPKPMDRLLCGDVGYGKTEVAMRAAFKAVMDGKQVAILSPTTVLAYQHHKTFSARLAHFPVRVDLLSRFRNPAQQKETLKAMAAGEVDVVVGTHRLLSADVKFRDLGLLVVDEEQRFGVAHKEKLKRLRKRVDVLTMTATPIPRTLHMSLVGVRDMSVIETPPRNRLSIHTNVVPFRGELVASAIRKELEREGQVFFVHNRVASIHSMAQYIRRLVPEAKVAVAHGQMGEGQLEKVMFGFIGGETNVLVTSTIIENGLDIPRVNTIIVNRADRFGLSQLYQLRGRVGRSDRRAFAYLLIPTKQGLTPIARKRLAALREFSDLGAGFRIAALDLELRGAGNLLGREQHGQIASIGFDLYTRMLRQAVSELKGEALPGAAQATISLGVDTHIPHDYVPEATIRLSLHKRLASVRDEVELEDLLGEIEDRFGPAPQPLGNLIELARLRLRAEQLGIESVESEGRTLAVKISTAPAIDGQKLVELLAENDDFQFSSAGVLTLSVPPGTPLLAAAGELLQRLG